MRGGNAMIGVCIASGIKRCNRFHAGQVLQCSSIRYPNTPIYSHRIDFALILPCGDGFVVS
jgi:hypothetical protein